MGQKRITSDLFQSWYNTTFHISFPFCPNVFLNKSSTLSRFKTWIWLRQFSFYKISMHVILPKRINWTNIISRLRSKNLNGPNLMSEPGFIAKVAKSQKVFSISSHIQKWRKWAELAIWHCRTQSCKIFGFFLLSFPQNERKIY